MLVLAIYPALVSVQWIFASTKCDQRGNQFARDAEVSSTVFAYRWNEWLCAEHDELWNGNEPTMTKMTKIEWRTGRRRYTIEHQN